MVRANVLVVDDEPTQRKLIEHVLTTKLGFNTVSVAGGQEAIDYVLSRTCPVPEVVLLDLSMPKVNGMQVIKRLRPIFPNLPIIVLTIYGDIDKAVAAIKAGATDFLAKPVAHERLRTSIQNALTINRLSDELERVQRASEGQVLFSDILGNSKAINAAKNMGKRAAESSIPVLIEGESGVGKELFARAIHGASERAGKAFVAINCGAIPENLAESVLFGHEKGAFTGATYQSYGKFREADGGTLFLDEVSELSPAMQVKLLRVLQEREVQPVGSKATIAIDVRVISATNCDLEQLVEQGKFREDLYYRLNVFPMIVPSLRERGAEDISLLAENFLRRFAVMENKQLCEISPEAMKLLQGFHWPGNVRQLENLIFRLVVLNDHEVVDATDLYDLLPASYTRQFNVHMSRDGLMHSRRLSLLDDSGNMRKMREIEQDVLYFALRFYDGKISKVARMLGIGRSTLYRKMNDYGIELAS